MSCAGAKQPSPSWLEIRITEAELQQQASFFFPHTQRAAVQNLTVLIFTLSHPQMMLRDDDRVYIRIKTGWHFPDIRIGSPFPVLRPGFTGYLLVSGRFVYESGDGDFYLRDLAIHEGHVPGLPERYDPEAQEVLAVVARTYLNNLPVYTLRDKGLKGDLGRLIVRAVEIRQKALFVTIGWP
jgi:hypothetical protein